MFLWIDDNPGILFIDGVITPVEFNCVFRADVTLSLQIVRDVTLWK